MIVAPCLLIVELVNDLRFAQQPNVAHGCMI
jgi:hypothetical protein